MTMDPLSAISRLAGAGLEAQASRLKVVAQNMANVRSTGDVPGADPYQRRTIVFEAVLDRQIGARSVEVGKISTDPTPFRIEHLPGHPAADAEGNVKMPNVNMLIEMADMQEANRTYEANLQMIGHARSMAGQLLDLLRSR
jgi:flagellar basal-body rod protein FlgC